MVIDFNTLYDLPKDMDRFFTGLLQSSGLGQRKTGYPLINVSETADSYVVDVCLPGVPAEELEITLAARSLIIKGERKAPEGRYYRQERSAGSFQRIISLNVPVERDSVTAKSENGIVRVTLPKSEEIKPRRISIG
ncbi:Hsp20/alpha crystallin family protein [Desulfovibrio sp. OttesenSCG-928-I05]|nr:Hsp20/alpha crystallin family protein [Desulfovibrio sp. OttesenSCG-928-I05]